MNKKDSLKLFAFVVVITLFSLFTIGYEPVHSDETTYLSLIKYYNDPSLYSKDLLISETLPSLPLYFYWVAGKLSEVVDKDILFFFIYLLTRALLILSIFFLAYTLFENKVVAYLSVIALILIRGLFVLASYDILDRIVFPFFLAVPLLLFSLAFFIKERYLFSFVILAVAMYLHAITSIFLFLIYIFYFIIHTKKINRAVIGSGILFILLSIPVIIKSLLSVSSKSLSMDEWLNFLRLRVLEHFFPLSWSIMVYTLFAVLVAMFLISFKYKPEKNKHEKVFAVFIGSLLLFLIGLAFTEIFPVKTIIQANFFRGMIIIRILAFVYIINYIVNVFAKKENFANKTVAMGMAITLLSAAIVPMFVGAHIGPFNEVDIEKSIEPWEEISIKAKEVTPKDSLFITPPFNLGFTYFSERSEFINWKTSGIGTYSDKFVAEAIGRFELVCNHPLDFSSRTELVETCKQGYDSLNELDLKNAKEKYQVTHIIVQKPKTLNLKKVYENEQYVIYEL